MNSKWVPYVRIYILGVAAISLNHGIICGKGKDKVSLCLTKHHAMKAYWEWRYSSRDS